MEVGGYSSEASRQLTRKKQVKDRYISKNLIGSEIKGFRILGIKELGESQKWPKGCVDGLYSYRHALGSYHYRSGLYLW